MSDPAGAGGGLADGAAPTPGDDGVRERTAMSWARTGLGFAATGAVIMRLLAEEGVGGAPVWLSVVLVALGAVAWCWGWRTTELAPAIESRAGRAVVRTLALGLVALVAGAVVLRYV